MDLGHLQALFDEAKRLTNHTEFVVIGSLSILGVVGDAKIPARMLMSIDVDCYTRRDPARIFELRGALGEASDFQVKHGYYLDAVAPTVATLPDGWEARLVAVKLERDIVVQFLDPNDAAVSKYARSEPRDREWIRAGLAAGLLNLQIITSRFAHTEFDSEEERASAYAALEQDRRKTKR